MKLKNIKKIVIVCLTEKPVTRNSDRILYNEVCSTLGYNTKEMSAWDMLHDCRMPSTESVRRARQKIQAEFPELRACEPVEKKRMELVSEYKEFAKSTSSEPLLCL